MNEYKNKIVLLLAIYIQLRCGCFRLSSNSTIKTVCAVKTSFISLSSFNDQQSFFFLKPLLLSLQFCGLIIFVPFSTPTKGLLNMATQQKIICSFVIMCVLFNAVLCQQTTDNENADVSGKFN